jgi:hypothetical protein
MQLGTETKLPNFIAEAHPDLAFKARLMGLMMRELLHRSRRLRGMGMPQCHPVSWTKL